MPVAMSDDSSPCLITAVQVDMRRHDYSEAEETLAKLGDDIESYQKAYRDLLRALLRKFLTKKKLDADSIGKLISIVATASQTADDVNSRPDWKYRYQLKRLLDECSQKRDN